MKGNLIVIDGTDGSGKATQTKLLVERLKNEGYPVEYIDFPQYGKKSAALVEEYLNGKFGSAEDVGPYPASIFYACDRYAASFDIKRWLIEGKIVVLNRYVSSNMGHQAGKIKNPKERDKFLDWLDELEYGLFKVPKPDLTLLLYVPPKIGQKNVDQKPQTAIGLYNQDDYQEKVYAQKATREYIEITNSMGGKSKEDIHEKDLEHLKNAAKAYEYVAKKYSWTVINCVKDEKLLTREEIHRLIWEQVRKLTPKVNSDQKNKKETKNKETSNKYGMIKGLNDIKRLSDF